MPDNGERTELPTGKRLDEASRRGQVAYSREMTSALMFLILLGGLRLWGGDLLRDLTSISQEAFSLAPRETLVKSGVVGFLAGMATDVTSMLAPLLLLVVAIVLLSGFMQVGVAFHFERAKTRWEKLNPVAGAKKLMSMRSVFMVGMQFLKLVAVGVIVWTALSDMLPRARSLGRSDFDGMAAVFVEGIFTIGFRVGGLVLLLGIIDLLWTRFKHTQDLMMTKDEVKEERKQADGNPEVKGRIKSIQKELARARMMKDVKTATVVVRNPTHYAVALRYDREKERSPRLVAKGRNLLAMRIIEIAEDAGVPVRSEPPLARQIYRTVKVGHVIPEELFRAVARILAWVFRQQKGRAA